MKIFNQNNLLTLVALALLLPFLTFSQEYIYKHYDNDDGLAGNTVYCVTQDTKGYIWFGTDNGLSRFDGKNFTNFTTKDGLPDNEVLKVFADSYGRIWISTFNKNICYYKDGIIKTKDNDSLLKNLVIDEFVEFLFETHDKLIFARTKNKIIKITEYKVTTLIENTGENFNKRILGGGYDYGNRKIYIILNSNNYQLVGDNLVLVEKNILNDSKNYFGISFKTNGEINLFKKPINFISVNYKKNYATHLNTHAGALKFDTTNGKIIETFLPNQRVSYTFEDKEKNLWFTTLGNGIFKLKSEDIKLYKFDQKQNNNSEVFCLNKINNNICAGVSFGKYHSINIQSFKVKATQFPENIKYTQNAVATNRLTAILPLSNKISFLGFDSYFLKIDQNKKYFLYFKPIKSLAKVNSNCILIGTSNYAITMNANDLKIIDTVYKFRCTAVNYFNNDYYIGTQNGLIINQKIQAKIKERITDIKVSCDSIVWIATSSNGVYGLKNKQIIYHLNDKLGLTSNNIKSLFCDKTNLWVGTFHGLNKFNLKQKSIVQYTQDDGLPSNIINAIYVDNNQIWLGTNLGLTTFDESKINKNSFCNIDLVKIKSADTTLNYEKIELANNKNNISFEHNGISFKSEKPVRFMYKMEGLDSFWLESFSRIVSYPSLPSGNYTFKIYAENKFGVKSNILSYPIFVATPFWKKPLFVLLAALAIVLIATLLVLNYIKRIRKRNEEKTKYINELNNAKQIALQTQMNPHFIFNCLNNIQKFVFKNDVESTNKYLTEFGTLIRTTLLNSDKLFISLADEIDYLQRYLRMENLRFNNKLKFIFQIDDDINIDEVEIPTMLLQPFIENSVKHGVLNLKNKQGQISVIFKNQQQHLLCKIIDNGVGRVESAKLKLNEHMLFESKGVEITSNRIEIFNQNKINKIKLDIIDLYDAQNQPIGTEVNLLIPKNMYA